MANKFDDLLVQLGTGRWNYLYFITTSVLFSLVPPQSLSGAYMAPKLRFTCRPPEDVNATILENSCSYIVNSTVGGEEVEVEMACKQFDYDTSVYHSTLTSEFDLVCNKEYLRATYQGMIMFGSFFTPLIGGYLADRFGRRIVVIIALALFTTFSSCVSFLTNFYAILVFRFVVGCMKLPTFYILAMEVCEPKMRSFVGILTALPWALGTMAFGGVGYLIRDWRILNLVVSLPNLIIFPALYMMDESPRWLIIRGHHDRAISTLKKAAKWNGSSLPPEDELRKIMKEIQMESDAALQEEARKKSLSQKSWVKRLMKAPILFRTRRISLITVVMCVDYLVVAMVFYGLSLSGTSLSADPFMYMVLTGLMEVPGYTLTAPVIARFGRKNPSCCGFFICGAAIFALAFIPKDITWLVMGLALTGKLFISGAYQIVYVYITELFPTEVRTTGMGSAIVTSRIGSILSPYVTDFLGPLFPWAPSIVFGASSLLAGAVTLILRETQGTPLPDTIADLETIGKRRRSSANGVPGELVSLSK